MLETTVCLRVAPSLSLWKKALVHWSSVGGQPLDTRPQLFASKVDFPFQRLCLFTGCWVGNSQTLFSVTLMMCQGLPRGSAVRTHLPMQETQVRSLIWEDLLSYAVDQLSPRATAREPVLWSPWAPASDNPGACSLSSAAGEARPPQLGGSPTRESLHSSRGLAQPK